MDDHPGAIVVEDGFSRYGRAHGFQRSYPRSELPVVKKPSYSLEEQELLSKPLITRARR